MSTRAMVGYKLGTDKVYGIYSHWDGYPSGLGAVLQHYYNNRRRASRLVEGGDISSISWDSGQALYYADRSTWSDFDYTKKQWKKHSANYNEDEKWNDVKPKQYDNLDDFIFHNLRDDSMIAFLYIFDDGRWRCFRKGYKTKVVEEMDLDIKYLEKCRKKFPKDFKTIKRKKVA